MEAILVFRPRTLKSHKFGSVCGRRGGEYGPRQGLPWAMCDGLDKLCKQAMFAGLIPTFKLSSYFSFASFWLAVRLFLDKKIWSIGSQQPFKVTFEVIKRRPKVFCWSCDEDPLKGDKKICRASHLLLRIELAYSRTSVRMVGQYL